LNRAAPARESIKWLQSLKDRVQPQPKQEWSEEDEKISNALYESIDFLSLKSFGFSEDEVCDWLKSLKAQTHWKPSEKQMKWLKDVIDTVPMTCRQQLPLESLYNDLKNL